MEGEQAPAPPQQAPPSAEQQAPPSADALAAAAAAPPLDAGWDEEDGGGSWKEDLRERVTLNPADCDGVFGFIGDDLLRGRRNSSKKQWAGARATAGIMRGKAAFCIVNNSGGNLRLGWSTPNAKLELGMDAYGYGFGGTGTKSHKGGYEKWGQTFGKDETITCLLDLDKHEISIMKGEHLMPGVCHTIDRDQWGTPFFPHVLTKEASFSVFFGGAAPPQPGIEVPKLPPGFQWIADRPVIQSPKGGQMGAATAQIVGDRSKEAEEREIAGLRQACHAWQFEPWKIAVTEYTKHFQGPLAGEYEAEKNIVAHRLARFSKEQLEAAGFGAYGCKAELLESGDVRITHRGGGDFPRLPQLQVGCEVFLSANDADPAGIGAGSNTITGELTIMGVQAYTLRTTYERLPPSKDGLYRLDVGPNVTHFQQIDQMLHRLQRADPPNVNQKGLVTRKEVRSDGTQNVYKLGIVNPGTALATALFENVAATAAAAQTRDPCQRPMTKITSDLAVAARLPHAVPKAQWVPRSNPLPAAAPLNRAQYAVVNAVCPPGGAPGRQLTLVAGPPATGKTYLAAEICLAWVKSSKGPILCTAATNTAVDAMADMLHNKGVNVLRLGTCPLDAPWSARNRAKAGKGSKNRAGATTQVNLETLQMRECDVVCCTCLYAAAKVMKDFEFPFVIVDEATQIMEPAVLIPMSKGSVQVVLMGDPGALPASVISPESKDKGMDVSLFERIYNSGLDAYLLPFQHRMHASISYFSSFRFYENSVFPGAPSSSFTAPFLPLFQGLLARPLSFVHVHGKEQQAGSSKQNTEEARCVGALVAALLTAGVTPGEIGIITPYGGQVPVIRQAVGLAPGPTPRGSLLVSTVDAFQGTERKIVILSTVRSNDVNEVGYVADWRRLNVALTRARSLCCIVGNLVTLCGGAQIWRDWVGFHGCLPQQQHVDWLEWVTGAAMLAPLAPTGAAADALVSAMEGLVSQPRDMLPVRGFYLEKQAVEAASGPAAAKRPRKDGEPTAPAVSVTQLLSATRARLAQERKEARAAANPTADKERAAVAFDIEKSAHMTILGPQGCYAAELERKCNLSDAQDLVDESALLMTRLVLPRPTDPSTYISVVGPKRKVMRARWTFGDFLRFNDMLPMLRGVLRGPAINKLEPEKFEDMAPAAASFATAPLKPQARPPPIPIASRGTAGSSMRGGAQQSWKKAADNIRETAGDAIVVRDPTKPAPRPVTVTGVKRPAGSDEAKKAAEEEEDDENEEAPPCYDDAMLVKKAHEGVLQNSERRDELAAVQDELAAEQQRQIEKENRKRSRFQMEPEAFMAQAASLVQKQTEEQMRVMEAEADADDELTLGKDEIAVKRKAGEPLGLVFINPQTTQLKEVKGVAERCGVRAFVGRLLETVDKQPVATLEDVKKVAGGKLRLVLKFAEKQEPVEDQVAKKARLLKQEQMVAGLPTRDEYKQLSGLQQKLSALKSLAARGQVGMSELIKTTEAQIEMWHQLQASKRKDTKAAGKAAAAEAAAAATSEIIEAAGKPALEEEDEPAAPGAEGAANGTEKKADEAQLSERQKELLEIARKEMERQAAVREKELKRDQARQKRAQEEREKADQERKEKERIMLLPPDQRIIELQKRQAEATAKKKAELAKAEEVRKRIAKKEALRKEKERREAAEAMLARVLAEQNKGPADAEEVERLLKEEMEKEVAAAGPEAAAQKRVQEAIAAQRAQEARKAAYAQEERKKRVAKLESAKQKAEAEANQREADRMAKIAQELRRQRLSAGILGPDATEAELLEAAQLEKERLVAEAERVRAMHEETIRQEKMRQQKERKQKMKELRQAQKEAAEKAEAQKRKRERQIDILKKMEQRRKEEEQNEDTRKEAMIKEAMKKQALLEEQIRLDEAARGAAEKKEKTAEERKTAAAQIADAPVAAGSGAVEGNIFAITGGGDGSDADDDDKAQAGPAVGGAPFDQILDNDQERMQRLFDSSRSLPPWVPRRAMCCGKNCRIEQEDGDTVKLTFEDGYQSWFPKAGLLSNSGGKEKEEKKRALPRSKVIDDVHRLMFLWQRHRDLPPWNEARGACCGLECYVEEEDKHDRTVKLRFDDGFFSWFPRSALEGAEDEPPPPQQRAGFAGGKGFGGKGKGKGKGRK